MFSKDFYCLCITNGVQSGDSTYIYTHIPLPLYTDQPPQRLAHTFNQSFTNQERAICVWVQQAASCRPQPCRTASYIPLPLYTDQPPQRLVHTFKQSFTNQERVIYVSVQQAASCRPQPCRTASYIPRSPRSFLHPYPSWPVRRWAGNLQSSASSHLQ